MYNGLLHLHSLLRWIIIVLLLLNLFRLSSGNNSTKFSLWLLISAHITLLLGLYQYIFGSWGLALFRQYGSEVMRDPAMRFWAVEHITGMLLAIAFITIGHIRLKKSGKTKPTLIFYLIAFIIIMLVVPWPFRAGIGRPWFPGM